MTVAGYGWVRDLPDQRDFLYAPPSQVAAALPERVDLRSRFPPPYNQEQLGSCTANAIAGALQERVSEYLRLTPATVPLLTSLASGYPFVFGFSVYESFETAAVAQSGVANLPGPSERLVGGHAVVAVGYDQASARFLVRNSWGAQWGMGGHFTLPYEYLTDPMLAADFWTIRKVPV